MAIRGRIARTPSTVPRKEGLVLSVTQALNAASFAVEPNRVITQSPTITAARVMDTAVSSSTPKILIASSGER